VAVGGTATASAKFLIYGVSTLNPVASISASSAKAAFVVDNTVGDLFTASSSGLSRFVITQNGRVGVGTTEPTTNFEVVGLGRISDTASNLFINGGNQTVSGNYNVGIGEQALNSVNGGGVNVAVGLQALYSNTSAGDNTAVGAYAGYSAVGGGENTFLGDRAGYSVVSGSKNVFVGRMAGYNATGANNVFIGYKAGMDETTSNKLYIANTETTTPLIYGDFNNQIVDFNGSVGIGSVSPGYALDVNGTANAHIAVFILHIINVF
jgi:hypothetical protein